MKPQIGPQMILDVDRKWSRRKTRNRMKFGSMCFIIVIIIIIISIIYLFYYPTIT